MSWSPLDQNDPSNDALIGDEPFDLVAECFGEIVRLYERDWNRKPSLRELVGTVKAVLGLQLQDHTSDGESAELTALTFKTKKIRKRQKYTPGDILKALAANGEPVYGRVFDPEFEPQSIGASCGPFVGVYDSLGMAQSELDAIIQRPLLVKPFPIHRENLEKRAWLVIGHRPLTEEDRRQPIGPLQIGGNNQQLEVANYYYDLGPKTFYNMDDCLVRKKGGGEQGAGLDPNQSS